MSDRRVSSLRASDLGRQVCGLDFRGDDYAGTLVGIEIYPMPRRTVLHIEHEHGWHDDFRVHPDFEIIVGPVRAVSGD